MKKTFLRTGKVVQLSVHTEDESQGKEVVQSVSRVLPGTYSILNLDPKVSFRKIILFYRLILGVFLKAHSICVFYMVTLYKI